MAYNQAAIQQELQAARASYPSESANQAAITRQIQASQAPASSSTVTNQPSQTYANAQGAPVPTPAHLESLKQQEIQSQKLVSQGVSPDTAAQIAAGTANPRSYANAQGAPLIQKNVNLTDAQIREAVKGPTYLATTPGGVTQAVTARQYAQIQLAQMEAAQTARHQEAAMRNNPNVRQVSGTFQEYAANFPEQANVEAAGLAYSPSELMVNQSWSKEDTRRIVLEGREAARWSKPHQWYEENLPQPAQAPASVDLGFGLNNTLRSQTKNNTLLTNAVPYATDMNKSIPSQYNFISQDLKALKGWSSRQSDKISAFQSYARERGSESNLLGKVGWAAAYGLSMPIQAPLFVIGNAEYVKPAIVRTFTEPSATFTELGGAMAADVKADPVFAITSYAAPFAVPRVLGKIGEVKHIGKELVPAEKIVEPAVLSGEKQFPTTTKSPTGLVTEFKTGKYRLPGETEGGFHATTASIAKETITQAGSSESPGLYIAPSLSKYFLRTGSEGGYKPFGLFDKPSSPTALYVRTDVARIPQNIRSKGFEAMNKFLESASAKGKAYISPAFEAGKSEKEAILGPGTPLKMVDASKITKIDSKLVPIKTYAIAGSEAASGAKLETFKSISKSQEEYYNFKKPVISAEKIFKSGAIAPKRETESELREVKYREIKPVYVSDLTSSDSYIRNRAVREFNRMASSASKGGSSKPKEYRTGVSENRAPYERTPYERINLKESIATPIYDRPYVYRPVRYKPLMRNYNPYRNVRERPAQITPTDRILTHTTDKGLLSPKEYGRRRKTGYKSYFKLKGGETRASMRDPFETLVESRHYGAMAAMANKGIKAFASRLEETQQFGSARFKPQDMRQFEQKGEFYFKRGVF